MDVKVEKPSQEKLDQLGVENWPIWEKEVSEFDWSYDQKETCYLLKGKAEVKTPAGKISFKKGDLVIFPKGLDCKWKILEDVKKHYTLG